MKKILILAIASAAVISACGTKTVIREVAATTTTVPETMYDEYGTDVYIEHIASEYPHLINNLGKPWLITFGQNVCVSIDGGTTVNDFIEMAGNYNIDAGMLGYLLGESIRNFCPENQWFIDAALGA